MAENVGMLELSRDSIDGDNYEKDGAHNVNASLL
jgi:hypothetical protein